MAGTGVPEHMRRRVPRANLAAVTGGAFRALGTVSRLPRPRGAASRSVAQLNFSSRGTPPHDGRTSYFEAGRSRLAARGSLRNRKIPFRRKKKGQPHFDSSHPERTENRVTASGRRDTLGDEPLCFALGLKNDRLFSRRNQRLRLFIFRDKCRPLFPLSQHSPRLRSIAQDNATD